MTARYTLGLASKNFSSWSLRPWLAMKMANLPFDEVVVQMYQPDTAKKIAPLSPSGKLPVLIIKERGQTYKVWDSLAICETLAERHPEARLWPKSAAQRAQARSIAAEMHAGFPDLRKLMPMDMSHRKPKPEGDETLDKQIARVIALWTSTLKQSGGPFLFGSFSIADALYAPVVTRFETYGVKLPAAARAYAKHISALKPMLEWREAAQAEVDAVKKEKP
jgi:glutathione S-transferase